MKQLDFYKVLGEKKSNRAFIFFHGWKGNKDSFVSLPKIMDVSNIDWYFPEAPYLIEGKDKKSWAFESSPGVYEIDETEKLLDLFIQEHIAPKYSLENVYIMGFSQGAAVCYELFLNKNYNWAAVFPVGGFLRNLDRNIELNKNQIATPVIIGHGMKDEIIPIARSKKIYNLLLDKGANVEFMEYNGSHKISMDYLKQIKVLLNEK